MRTLFMFITALALAAGCTASPPPTTPDAGPAFVVPGAADCLTYEQFIADGKIVPVADHYRIIVLPPFVPLDGVSSPAAEGAYVLVWTPELAGGRLGAVGRTNVNSNTCIW